MFADPTDTAIPIHILTPDQVEAWAEAQDDFVRAYLGDQPFKAGVGDVAVLPGADGRVAQILAGWGEDPARRRELFPLGNLRKALPEGVYALRTDLTGDDLDNVVLSWALAGYRFDRYKPGTAKAVDLVAPDGVDADGLAAVARGAALTCDLVNTPANDMGPEALEAAVRSLAESHGAEVTVTEGAALLDGNFPLIHTVGRAGAQAPRLIEMTWGEGPAVTLVGKGVCFDTGGLNLKPGASMALMKKDMGGAATVLGLASMIMETGLKFRLRVLIPAVENAVAGNAFRPGDILTSRKGLTVEINNTDAEGRLVLADALALACEDPPEVLICMATLTGAARVALGPEVVPYYTDDWTLSAELAEAGGTVADPLWPMPLWPGYESMIEPGIADLDNSPKGGMAGSITAALFLNRFVEGVDAFAHFDCYAWTPTAKPGRPKGGACQAARAVYHVLKGRYG